MARRRLLRGDMPEGLKGGLRGILATQDTQRYPATTPPGRAAGGFTLFDTVPLDELVACDPFPCLPAEARAGGTTGDNRRHWVKSIYITFFRASADDQQARALQLLVDARKRWEDPSGLLPVPDSILATGDTARRDALINVEQTLGNADRAVKMRMFRDKELLRALNNYYYAPIAYFRETLLVLRADAATIRAQAMRSWGDTEDERNAELYYQVENQRRKFADECAGKMYSILLHAHTYNKRVLERQMASAGSPQ